MSIIELYHTSFYVSWLSILLPLILIGLNIQKQPLAIRWLFFYLLFSFFCDLALELGYRFFSINLNTIVTFYHLISLPLICTFIYYLLDRPTWKLSLTLINIGYILFVIINFLFIQKSNPNSYSQTIHAFIIIVLCLAYYYKLLHELPTGQIHRLPGFWICSALFITFSGKIFIYTVTHYLVVVARDNMALIWTFHNFLSLICNLLIGLGVWLNHKQLKST